MTREQTYEMHEAGMALGDIAAKLDLPYDGEVLQLPITVADDGNGDVEYGSISHADAAQSFVGDGSWGDGGESFAVLVHTWVVGMQLDEDDGLVEVRVDEQSHLIVVHPDEPDCHAGRDHDWEEVRVQVGGGCAIRSTDRCLRCWLVRVSTGPSQGWEQEHDHSTVTYTPPTLTVQDLINDIKDVQGDCEGEDARAYGDDAIQALNEGDVWGAIEAVRNASDLESDVWCSVLRQIEECDAAA